MSDATGAASTAPQKIEDVFDAIYKEGVPAEVAQKFPRLTTPYRIKYENWYKTIPYAFRISPAKTPTATAPPQPAFFFPVNPENISINTPFATVVTPTIGGIVQEHSGAVFYNITISGTTGILPAMNLLTGDYRSPNNELRPLGGESLIPSLGGFGQSTINTLNSAISAITGTSSKMVDSKRNRNSGYTAFHMLYKFLWLYHFAKANGSSQQLKFMNYKDNNQYDCVVQNFSLNRDKSKPHLYQYNIQLKAWKLNQQDQPIPVSARNLSDLGLDSGPSVRAALFRVVNSAKTILNAGAGILNAAAQDLVF